MLFNNLTEERRASLIVKNSRFYIELAKFVQAYTTIVKNPNEFLVEIGELEIDVKKQHLSWEQLVKIIQTCDLGFTKVPSRMDLVVYYNYALEMGSVKALDRKIATVDQVAEAQKHYYNFVDEEKTIAEGEYQKQKKIYDARQREMGYVDGKISISKTKNYLCVIAMVLSIMVGLIGIAGMLADNIIVSAIGRLLPIWEPRYVGGIILIILMFLFFALFNHLYVKTRCEYVKLKHASATIFAKEEELVSKQMLLKKKLDEVNKAYKRVIKEINDKKKRYDVKHNIEILKTTNKFYKKLCEVEQLSEISEKAVTESMAMVDDDFAPIKLTKEQEENIRAAKKEVIGLAGQIDMDAYNEKFENRNKDKFGKDGKDKESELEDEELSEKIKEQKAEQERKGFEDSMNYVKDLLSKPAENSTKEK